MQFTITKLVVFLILLLAISAYAQAPALQTGSPDAGGALGVILIMWSPGLAALATKLVLDRNVKGMGWGWGAHRYQALAYLFSPLIAGAVYGAVWMSDLAPLTTSGYGALIAKEFGIGDPLSLPAAIALLGSAGFLVNCLTVLGEEIGWRGFLFPLLLQRFGFAKASLITGAIWAVWHYPGIIWGGYNADGPLFLALVNFTVMLIGVSVIAGWLVLKTGSLWSGVILHASHNLYIQAVFDPLTENNEAATLLTTEWGLGLAAVYAIVAAPLLRLGGVKQPSASGTA